MRLAFPFLLAGLCALPLLAGCDQLGIETPDKILARQEAEGKAIGSACRHAGRALEDCYSRALKDKKNKYIAKAAIFTGWKEMDAYMRENNLAVVPVEVEPEPVPAVAPAEGEGGEATAKEAGDSKTEGEKGAAKAEAGKGESSKTPGKAGSGKPETKVEAPAEIKPRSAGKISAHLAAAPYA